MKRMGEKIKKLKIAFVGVSHWHVPLYLPAVESEEFNVVAVSDNDFAAAIKFAQKLSCRAYSDPYELLDEEKPDFVFAFDVHSKMPALAKALIERKIAFTIEKPLGLCTQDVIEVQSEAEKNNVFCAIPFVWRYSSLIQEFKRKMKADDIIHLMFKFIAGPPSRYISTSPWMLKKETAGGGCMTNLGVHFIDMAMYLTGSSEAKVLGSRYHYTSEYDIETYASALITLSSGATFSLETGYSYPMDDENKRDNRWNIVTKDGYYTLGDNAFEERVYGKDPVKIAMNTDSDVYYAEFAKSSLLEYVSGKKPSTSLSDMVAVRRVLDEMNKMAGRG